MTTLPVTATILELEDARVEPTPRAREKNSKNKAVDLYWAKTAGLFPSFEEIDDSLAASYRWELSAEYSEASHALMQHIFETKCDAEAMQQAANIIGAGGNVQAMAAVALVFTHGMGVAYGKSGWKGGQIASLAIDHVRTTLVEAWHGQNGFDRAMLANGQMSSS